MEDLGDDGFEGSNDELSIFREVLFGNYTGDRRKISPSVGLLNFESESSRNMDLSVCSNGESSALTSICASKNTSCEKSFVVDEDPGKISSFSNKNDQLSCVKGIEFPADQLASPVPDLRRGFSSSYCSNKNISGMSGQEKFIVAESSSKGVAYKSYVLKELMQVDNEACVGNTSTSNCRFTGSNCNGSMEFAAKKAIASPASQESIANRIVALSPSANAANKSSPLHADERPIAYDFPPLSVSSSIAKEPRRLLQQHAFHLLMAAGWLITMHQRPSRSYTEYKFRSPAGRSFREFSKAWISCGHMLLANQCALVQEYESKEWNDFSLFLSDLTNLLLSIEKEVNQLQLSNSLAHRWNLLDPFVAVMFIDKKIGILKKGVVVKVRPSLLTYMNRKRNAALAVNKNDICGDLFTVSQISGFLGDSSQACGSEVTAVDKNCLASAKQSSTAFSSGYGIQRTDASRVTFLTGISFRMADSGVTPFIQTVNATADYSRGNKICNLDSLPLPVPGPGDGTSSGHTLYYCPAYSESVSVPLEGFRTVSHLGVDGKSNCLSCNDEGSEHDVERHEQVLEDVSIKMRRNPAAFPCRCPRVEPGVAMLLNSGAVKQSGHGNEVDCSDVSADVSLRKKIRRKSKKISEIKSTSSSQDDIMGATLPNKVESPGIGTDSSHSELNEVQDLLATEDRLKGSCKSSCFSLPKYQSEKRKLKYKKISRECDTLKNRSKRRKCDIEDDELLVSAIMKNQEVSGSASKSTPKTKCRRTRARRMLKRQKGACRLCPRNFGKGGKPSMDLLGARTVLSWLINSGVISLNDVIQYRDLKDNTVKKDGQVTWNGIICRCCTMVLSVSQFKVHAGFKKNRPCLNLFMESGEPFALCVLEAWSSEYKLRKNGKPNVQVDNKDPNDDSCGICGDGGELICCDNCPSTFHQACLLTEDLPEGNWYCPNCTCRVCGCLVDDNKAANSNDALKCLQCEHKYHESCMKEKNVDLEITDGWFCGEGCQEVYSGLRSRIGLINHIEDGLSWTLLRCIHDDQKVRSAQGFALKAECNSKLAVALTIMEECFVSMLDPRTGIDMIPHVLYNWGSDFARLNFHGFYTMVLEKDDVLISAACVRIHGIAVAEMPLIATCSKYRRQGMCRCLMIAIEKLLVSFGVEKLVIAAIPDLVQTWTEGFGFKIVEKGEKEALNKINLMVFPGTVLLKKSLYTNQKAEALLSEHELTTKSIQSAETCYANNEEADAREVIPKEGELSRETELTNGIGQGVCNAAQNFALADETSHLPTTAGISSKEEPAINCVHPSAENLCKDELKGIEESSKFCHTETAESVQVLKSTCCASLVSHMDIEDSLVVVGQETSSQDQFSKPSCHGPLVSPGEKEKQTGRGCNVDTLMVFDQTQLSCGEEARKACELYGK
ncbi:increased DNA methylation 1 isoform X2 [Rhodamnia argentea]|uniref:Increased DNA methylation 1 isoform X2 n=1 Tax=Rhodamnia argentea TaxID=178133 RepID=A0A8B8QUV6_9MYRT|nr:increased DNA methylation 1 isoform X2 [Rhodamnia argentea]